MFGLYKHVNEFNIFQYFNKQPHHKLHITSMFEDFFQAPFFQVHHQGLFPWLKSAPPSQGCPQIHGHLGWWLIATTSTSQN